MNIKRRIYVSIVWVILGIGLNVACFVTEMDAFWSGVGTALLFVGILQLIRWRKYVSDSDYREKMDVESKDERNRYLTGRAWGWAGYLFVLISAIACIVFRILGEHLLSLAASSGVCLIVALYWISYLILKRKY